ncbi:MAG: hypothetical protein ACRELT_16460, partial [Longimicrobiales bacterium]
PILSYALMGILVLVPGTVHERSAEIPDAQGERLPGALLSMAVGGMIGLTMVWLGAELINSYGLALFMGTPFCIGLVTAYTLCRRFPATSRETHEVVVMTMLLVAGAAFVVGLEGAICLLMIAPLGLVLALMGGAAGRFLATAGEAPGHGAVLIAILLPGGAAVEAGSNPTLAREVRSAVVIDAPSATVWDHVIAFSPIPEPTEALFRLGLAYPVSADIRGSGVGAVRYCVFSTGAFVEPITAWDPAVRLAFDVIAAPPPLKELSYRDVAPPHMDGYLLPRRGEFRLVPLADGRTRLEGSTWYEQRLRPEGYWVLFSDRIIGAIHRRVLAHIRAQAESAATAGHAPAG